MIRMIRDPDKQTYIVYLNGKKIFESVNANLAFSLVEAIEYGNPDFNDSKGLERSSADPFESSPTDKSFYDYPLIGDDIKW